MDSMEQEMNSQRKTIAENSRLIDQMGKIIDNQQKIIKKNQNITRQLTSELHQLIGGLYNQTKQKSTIDSHVSHLNWKKSPEAWQKFYEESLAKKDNLDEPDYWGIWPTTRQGDMLEERMKELQQSMNKIEEWKKIHSKREILESKISHIDELSKIERCNELEERIALLESKLLEKEEMISGKNDISETSSESSEERIKNSNYLCGNE